jgi:hypothetical protein
MLWVSAAGCTGEGTNSGPPTVDAAVIDAPVAADAARDTSAHDAHIDSEDAATPDTSVDDVAAPDTSVADTGIDAPLDAPLDAAPDVPAFPTTPNLIVNGDAEAAVGGTGPVVPVPSWTSSGNATAVVYGAPGGYPALTDPVPADHGLNFFCGGPNDAASSFTQTIDLEIYASRIGLGGIGFELSAYLGGYATQSDNAVLTVTFRGDANASLGSASIGPVTPAERASATGFLFRSNTGAVPMGTLKVDVELALTRVEGSANDGYADNLVFVLKGI